MGDLALHGHYIERRSLATTSVSRDIAHHLYARQLPGLIVIVTNRPEVFMASVSKQWASVIRQVERQMASTLNPSRREELIMAIHHMHALRFSIKPFTEDEVTGVLFMSEAQCISSPPACHTMYLADELTNNVLNLVTANMLSYGLIVQYSHDPI